MVMAMSLKASTGSDRLRASAEPSIEKNTAIQCLWPDLAVESRYKINLPSPAATRPSGFRQDRKTERSDQRPEPPVEI